VKILPPGAQFPDELRIKEAAVQPPTTATEGVAVAVKPEGEAVDNAKVEGEEPKGQDDKIGSDNAEGSG